MKTFLSLVFLSAFFLTAKVGAYPQIITWRNSPLIVFENNNNAVLKKSQEIKSPFFALTSRLDELSLNLNRGNEIEIFKNSKIQIYEVFEDVQQEHILFLVDGSIRLKNFKTDRQQEAKPNRLRTPFFDLAQPTESDVIIQLNMKEPSVEVRVVKGSWKLEFYAYEKKVELKAGQQVKFKGVLSDEPDQIKYDFLMDEKKIPKGQLEEIRAFDISRFLEEKKVNDADIIKKEQQEKKKIADALKVKKKQEASFLCKNPFGNRNQCAWKQESGKCFRQRCNASGKWGDKTERPITASCSADFLVGSCDY